MDRRLSAVVLVQQSLLADARTCARTGITLDITENKIRSKTVDGKIHSAYIHKESYFIEYIRESNTSEQEFPSIPNIRKLASALGIPSTFVVAIMFKNANRVRAEIYIGGNDCFVNCDGCSLPISFSEAESAFMKLKELGYTSREWQL
jgi:hypothetical protein